MFLRLGIVMLRRSLAGLSNVTQGLGETIVANSELVAEKGPSNVKADYP